MNPLDKYMDMWNHHPRNHVIKGVVFMVAGVIGIGAVILLFYMPRIQPRRSNKLVPPTYISPTPSADIPVDMQFSSYNDITLKAQFSYPSTWVTKTEGDRNDWRVIVSDQQPPYFAVQLRRINNYIYSVDGYINSQFKQFSGIQVVDYDISGITYREVTGDPGITMYHLYTAQDNAIYEIAVMSAIKDKTIPAVVSKLKLADMIVRSFEFQSDVDMAKIKVDLQQLRAALEMYLVDKGSYPDNLDQLVPVYIPYIPTSPYKYYDYNYEPYNGLTTTYTITAYLPDGTTYQVSSP